LLPSDGVGVAREPEDAAVGIRRGAIFARGAADDVVAGRGEGAGGAVARVVAGGTVAADGVGAGASSEPTLGAA
jgi:hypothetical protein